MVHRNAKYAQFQFVTNTFILYMKDRIKQLMESQHMNQQSFASYIGLAPATLCSILQERTRPTLNTVEAICKKMPNVNLTWLVNGTGEMFVGQNSDQNVDAVTSEPVPTSPAQPSSQDPGMFQFTYEDDRQSSSAQVPTNPRPTYRQPAAKPATSYAETKNVDKPQRRITEIRVFYDDQTWESFVPKK